MEVISFSELKYKRVMLVIAMLLTMLLFLSGGMVYANGNLNNAYDLLRDFILFIFMLRVTYDYFSKSIIIILVVALTLGFYSGHYFVPNINTLLTSSTLVAEFTLKYFAIIVYILILFKLLKTKSINMFYVISIFLPIYLIIDFLL